MNKKKKTRYNLYYIFYEDKQKNMMSPQKWMDIKTKILKYPVEKNVKLDNHGNKH